MSLRTGERWAVNLIKCMCKIIQEFWKHRNDIVHKNSSHEAVKEKEINPTITSEWKEGSHNIQGKDRRLFSTNLLKLLCSPYAAKVQWVKSVNIARATAQKILQATGRGDNMALQRQRLCMYQWLGNKL